MAGLQTAGLQRAGHIPAGAHRVEIILQDTDSRTIENRLSYELQDKEKGGLHTARMQTAGLQRGLKAPGQRRQY